MLQLFERISMPLLSRLAWRCSRKGRERNNVSRIGGKFDSEVVK